MLPIHTLSSPWKSSLSHAPSRGGIITSLTLQDTEMLYLDRATFEDPLANVRGGIPLLFPNAGPANPTIYPALKQHGFARTSDTWQSRTEHDAYKFVECLESNEETRAIYPYDFSFTIEGQLQQDGSAVIRQTVTNPDSTEALPVSFGLHPYFAVPHEEKSFVKFDFPGGEIAEAKREVWMNGGTVSLSNPVCQDQDALVRIHIPNLGVLTLHPSPMYQRLWIWSLPEKDFLCIEPVLRDLHGLTISPEYVPPRGAITAELQIKLEPKIKT